MIGPLIEGGGLILGLALLYYFEIWRPARSAARERPDAAPDLPAASAPPDTVPGPDQGRP